MIRAWWHHLLGHRLRRWPSPTHGGMVTCLDCGIEWQDDGATKMWLR